jgi:hypothetical protein
MATMVGLGGGASYGARPLTARSEGSIVPRGLWISSCSKACPGRQDGCRAFDCGRVLFGWLPGQRCYHREEGNVEGFVWACVLAILSVGIHGPEFLMLRCIYSSNIRV